VRPIIHISIPVRDVAEAVAFYTSTLDSEIGKSNATSIDVLVFGAQITLQDDAGSVTHPMPRSRHFVAWDEWEEIAGRLRESECLVEGPAHLFIGEIAEQAKLMIADPSGNLIELKAYRNPEFVLGIPPWNDAGNAAR
jgi:uncharacterized protein